MKSTLFLLVSVSAFAAEPTYQFSAQVHRCIDRDGREGLNAGVVGECGNLRSLDLSGRDLSGISLLGADLKGANFDGANLQGADLRNTMLSGSNLFQKARLAGALYNEETESPLSNYCGENTSDELTQAGLQCYSWNQLASDFGSVMNAPGGPSLERVERLLKLRMDPDSNDRMAMKIAVELKNQALIDLLRRYGATAL